MAHKPKIIKIYCYCEECLAEWQEALASAEQCETCEECWKKKKPTP